MAEQTPATREQLFLELLQKSKQEREAELAAQPHAQPADNLVDASLDVVGAAGTGIAKAGIETVDAITTGFGLWGREKRWEERSDFEKAIFNDSAVYDRKSPVNAIVGDISQFVAGMLGAGKVKLAANAPAAAKFGFEVAKGSIIGATVFDPNEDRLSNLVQSFPELQNPVTDFLAADYTDSEAEGRFKAALEGAGMDILLAGVFKAAVKAFKASKSGAPEEVIKAADKELEEAKAAWDQGTTLPPAGQNPIDQGVAQKVLAEDEATRAGMAGEAEPLDATTRQLIEDINNPPPAGLPPQGNVLEQTGQIVPPATKPKLEPAPKGTPMQELEGMGREGGPLAPGTTVVRGEDGSVAGTVPPQKPGGPIEITVQGGNPELGAGVPPATPKGKAAPAIDIEAQAVDDILESSSADAAALAKYGTREAAEQAGHRFGAGGYLPWQKLTGPEEVQTFTDRVAERLRTIYDKAKGGDVLSDSRVDAMVAQRAATYGEDPSMLRGMLRSAGEDAKTLAANMEAAYLVGNKAMADTYALATRIRLGSLSEFGGDVMAAKKQLRLQLKLAVEMTAAAKSMTANAARAMRRMRREFQVTPEQLKALDAIEDDRLLEVLYQAQGNPKKLAQMADAGVVDRIIRGTGTVFANNLLWNWPSHVVNFATSAYMMGIRPAERFVGGLYQYGRSGFKDTSQMAQAVREYRYMAASVGDATHAAIAAFQRGDSVLAPHQTEWFKQGGASEAPQLGSAIGMGFKPFSDFPSLLHNALTAAHVGVTMPTRVLGTVDEFMKQTTYRGFVQARAAAEASAQGLEGAAAREYVQSALDDAFDAMGQAVDPEALYEAQVRTFSQPLLGPGGGWFGRTTAGATLQNAVAAHPALRLVFPFVRTPINVFRHTIKSIPGMNLLQKEYIDMIGGKRGPQLQAQAVGQMATGGIILTSAAMMASSGMLTGGGPKEPAQRAALEATGWKPYSIKHVADDGTVTFVPYNRFDPVGMQMGIITDLVEAFQTYPDRNPDDDADFLTAAGSTLLAVARNLSDKTYLQNVKSFLDAASDPERMGARLAGQTAEGLIPASSLLRQLNPDPYTREARTWVDHMLDRMPGFSANLPLKRDPYGDPIPIRTGLVFTDDATDLVEAEQQRLWLETGKMMVVPMSYNREGVDLRDLPVTKADGTQTSAWDALQELSRKPPGASKTMKEAIADVIKSEKYAIAEDNGNHKGTKLYLLNEVASKYREMAFKHLKKLYPKEVGEPLARRKLDTQAAIAEKRKRAAVQKPLDQAKELAGSYGININAE